MKKTLITKEKGKYLAKDILMIDDPIKLKALANPKSWKIMKLLSEKPMYPSEIAKAMDIYPQKIYYYINTLEKAGLIKIKEKKEISGGIAKYYELASPAFGIEFSFGEKEILQIRKMDEKLRMFFHPIIENTNFNGKIVVGSPEPHGPNLTKARDGHYGIHLSMFLGQFCNLPKDFIVKLDIDIKAEKEERNNMILIGGPGTNLITAEVNKYLPIKFNELNYWAGLTKNGTIYSEDADGLIAKIINPYDSSKRIIVLAGNRYIGTKACVIAISNFWKQVLKNYNGEDEWATVIRGLDLDGDGKIDSIKVLT